MIPSPSISSSRSQRQNLKSQLQEDELLREAQQYLKSENISPVRFPVSLSSKNRSQVSSLASPPIPSNYNLLSNQNQNEYQQIAISTARSKNYLQTIEQALSTPLSSHKDNLFSTNEDFLLNTNEMPKRSEIKLKKTSNDGAMNQNPIPLQMKMDYFIHPLQKSNNNRPRISQNDQRTGLTETTAPSMSPAEIMTPNGYQQQLSLPYSQHTYYHHQQQKSKIQTQKSKNSIRAKKQKDFISMKSRVGARVYKNLIQQKIGISQQDYQFATASFNGDQKQHRNQSGQSSSNSQLAFTFSNKKIRQERRGQMHAQNKKSQHILQTFGSDKEQQQLQDEKKEGNNQSSTIPDFSRQQLKPLDIDNLVMLEDNMNEKNIIQVLDQRCKSGKYFTYSGPVLISVNPRDPYIQKQIYAPFRLNDYAYSPYSENVQDRPHLYNVTLSAYNALISQRKNQVITLLGEKGTGKSRAMRHALQHLFRVRKSHSPISKNMIANRLQETNAALDLLSVLTSHTMIQDKGLYSYDNAAFVLKILYSNNLKNQSQELNLQPIGCQIESKLLDCTFPKSRFARSFDALHALFHTTSRKILSKIGIGHLNPAHCKLFYGSCSGQQERTITYTEESFKQYDRNRLKRMIQAFDILNFTKDEIYAVFDILAMVILLSEQKIQVKTQAPRKQWRNVDATLHKGAAYMKLQKLLAISELNMSKIFNQKNQKQIHRQIRTMQ